MSSTLTSAVVQQAIATWQSNRTQNLIRLARKLTPDSDLKQFVRSLVVELLSDNWPLITQKAAELLLLAGERIDQWLTWENIENEALATFLEQHDNPTAGIFKLLHQLDAEIYNDCEMAQGRSPEEMASGLARQQLSTCELMEVGKPTGFFHSVSPTFNHGTGPRDHRWREVIPTVSEPEPAPEAESGASEEVDALRATNTSLQGAVSDLHGQLTERDQTLAEQARRIAELEAQISQEVEKWVEEEPAELATDTLVPLEPEQEPEQPADPTEVPAPKARVMAALARDKAERDNRDRSSRPQPNTPGRGRQRRRLSVTSKQAPNKVKRR